MQDINIAVLGASGAGKSVFVRHALNLATAAAAGSVCARKMTIDGGIYTVRFLEMSFSQVDPRAPNGVEWPDKIEDLATPRIDGAAILYDVTNQESLAQVPEMLSESPLGEI